MRLAHCSIVFVFACIAAPGCATAAAPATTSQVAGPESESAGQKAAQDARAEYLASVLDDLRTSADVRERALGLSARIPGEATAAAGSVDAPGTPLESIASATALADLVAAYPDNAFVQWVAAIEGGNDGAIAAVQRLQPDNAAAWALALKPAGESPDILHRAAQATRFDDHSSERIEVLHAAFARHPMPAAQQAAWFEAAGITQPDDSAKAGALVNAMSLAGSSMQVAPSLTAWQSCDGAGSAKNAASTTDCVKIARLMLHSQDSLLTTLLGAGMLRTLGALEGADREYARRLYWWAASAGAMREHFGRYVDDYLATGSEIEATRRLMAAAGTLDPPAGWQPQEWTKASSAKAAATSR